MKKILIISCIFLIVLTLGYFATFTILNWEKVENTPVLTSQVSTLEESIIDLEEENSSLEGQILALQSEISSLQSQIEELQNQNSNELEGQIEELQNQISNLEGQIEELQSQIESSYNEGYEQGLFIGSLDFIFDEFNQSYTLGGETEYSADPLRYRGSATEIIIPDTFNGYPVTKIGMNYFNYSNIESLFIPASIVEIENGITGCLNLKYIEVDEDNLYYEDINNTFLVEKANNYLISYALGLNENNVVIPDGIQFICSGVFNSQNINSLFIPASVERIYNYTFSLGCGISSITFAENSNLTRLDDRAFYMSNVINLNLPASVNYFGENCFYMSNLETITINSSSVIPFGTSMFDGCNYLTTIYVPADLVDSYKSASGWSNYASKIQAIAE